MVNASWLPKTSAGQKTLTKLEPGQAVKINCSRFLGRSGGLINFIVPTVALDKKRLIAGRVPCPRAQLESGQWPAQCQCQ